MRSGMEEKRELSRMEMEMQGLKAREKGLGVRAGEERTHEEAAAIVAQLRSGWMSL